MSNKLLKIYFAGKVEDLGYRDKLIGLKENHNNVETTIMGFSHHLAKHTIENEEVGKDILGGEFIYAGPTVIEITKRLNHLSWCNKGEFAHGIVETDKLSINFDEKKAKAHRFYTEEDETTLIPTSAVQRCFDQINDCDAIHAYIDSFDCYGTIAELGYAAGINKPIYLVFNPSLKPMIPNAGFDAFWGHTGGYDYRDIRYSLESRITKDCYFNGISFDNFLEKCKTLPVTLAEIFDYEYCEYDLIKILTKHSQMPIVYLIDLFVETVQLNRHLGYPIHSISDRERNKPRQQASFDILLKDITEPEEGCNPLLCEGLKDELWFVKNLPSIRSFQYGYELTIDRNLLYFPPAPVVAQPQPQSVADRIKRLIRTTGSEDSLKKLGVLVANEYKRRNPNSTPAKINAQNAGVKIAYNTYKKEDWEWIDELLAENTEPDYSGQFKDLAIDIFKLTAITQTDIIDKGIQRETQIELLDKMRSFKALCKWMGVIIPDVPIIIAIPDSK